MEVIISTFIDHNLSSTIIESLAVIFSLLYVILAAKENIWCWSAALVSVSLYIFICFQAQLFAETGLQIFYFLMAIYGYFMWSKSGNEVVKQWSEKSHLLIIFVGAIFAFLIGFYFTEYTSSKKPIVDSFTTVFSIIATYMVVKKVLGNWLYWIVIDLVSVYLYSSRDLHLTSLLFFVYSIVAIFGYFNWRKRMKYD